jgi:hypothetical protein
MVALPPHPPAPVNRPVDRPRTTDRQPLRPPRERQLVIGLHDEVNVIGLHREVDQPKKGLAGRRERPTQLAEHLPPTQRREPIIRTQRNVHRMPRPVKWPRRMHRRRSRRRSPPPRVPPPSPPATRDRKIKLPSPPPAHVRAKVLGPPHRTVACLPLFFGGTVCCRFKFPSPQARSLPAAPEAEVCCRIKPSDGAGAALAARGAGGGGLLPNRALRWSGSLIQQQTSPWSAGARRRRANLNRQQSRPGRRGGPSRSELEWQQSRPGRRGGPSRSELEVSVRCHPSLTCAPGAVYWVAMATIARAAVSRAEWRRRVARWKSSGLTAKEFAAEMGINAGTLELRNGRQVRVAAGFDAEALRALLAVAEAA